MSVLFHPHFHHEHTYDYSYVCSAHKFYSLGLPNLSTPVTTTPSDHPSTLYMHENTCTSNRTRVFISFIIIFSQLRKRVYEKSYMRFRFFYYYFLRKHVYDVSYTR